MRYNAVIDVVDVTEGAITEPVTLQEAKDYMRLEGFTAVGGTELAFTDDDTLIEHLIIGVREKFEKITGLTLTPDRTKTAIITNLAGYQRIPYGPVKEIIEARNCEGTDITSQVKTVGLTDLLIKSPLLDGMEITYTCGYGTEGLEDLPAAIKTDMLRAVAYYYMNRGDDTKAGAFVSQLAVKYKKSSWLL